MSQVTASDAKAAWIARVLGLDVSGPAPRFSPGMRAWKAARARAVVSLRAAAAEVARMDYDEAPQAYILLRAIAANLTEEPDSVARIEEMRSYLTYDSIIEEAEEPNGFGIEIVLKKPLLAALDILSLEMSG